MINEREPLPNDISEDTLALRFTAEKLQGNAAYVHQWRDWMLWDGRLWRRDEALRHYTLAREFLREQAAGVKANQAIRLKSDKTCSAVVKLARSNPDTAKPADIWDNNPAIIGTPSGKIDLKTGEHLPADRGDYITRQAAVDPADSADCPQWLAFLERIFQGAPEVIPFMQRAAGYALTGETSEHVLLFAFGSGRNGKSVFFNTLSGLLGDYSTVAASSTFLDGAGDSHPTDLASLAGARLVTASELPAGKAWDETRLKSLTGGDPISARRMRQDFFTFVPQFTLMVAGNHMPTIRGVDEATRARMLMIPFAETIPDHEQDKDLPDKLRDEWPAILRWCAEGAAEWYRHGLQAPTAVRAASDEYLDEEDELGQFIEDCLIEDHAAVSPVKDVYTAFAEWSRGRGVKGVWSQRAFSQAMRERGYSIKRRSAGRCLIGFAVGVVDTMSAYARASGGF